MTLYIIKTLLSAALIVLVTEVARRGGALAGLIAALPFTSLLAIAWMRFDSTRIENIATFSEGVVWFVLPSLPFYRAGAIVARGCFVRCGVCRGPAGICDRLCGDSLCVLSCDRRTPVSCNTNCWMPADCIFFLARIC